MEKNIDNKNSKKKNYNLYFIIICLLIIFIVLFYPAVIGKFYHSNTDRGLAGDMYGILNALFSGLAFAGVIITILMQMQELELTREELTKTAEAQQGSHKALKEQLQSMNLSNKISGVSQYIESHNGINDQEKRLIAKLVLQDLVENVFYEERYKEYVRPNLIITGYYFNASPNESKVDKEFRIMLKNTAASANFRTISNKDDVRISSFLKIQLPSNNTKFERINNGGIFVREKEYLISLNKVNPHRSIEIDITMTGELVKVDWFQKIYIIADSEFQKVEVLISEVS